MSAFVVFTADILDGEKWKEYGPKGIATLADFEGEIVAIGAFEEAIVGNAKHSSAGVIRFPDIDAVNNWYVSDAYSALRELRDKAAKVTVTSYQCDDDFVTFEWATQLPK